MCASPRNVIIPPTPPTHPTDHPHSSMCATHHIRRLVCVHVLGTPTPPNLQRYVCVCAYSWECMQVQGMLLSPPHPPTQPKGMCVCVCVQLGMYASPRYVTIPSPPTHPPTLQRYVCVCVQLGMYASPRYVTIPSPPTHPPNPKVCVCVCVQLGMYASPRYVTIPTPPTHPPTTHPTQRYVCTDESPKTRCVYRWVRFVCADEAFGVCVQMSQICVRRWVPYPGGGHTQDIGRTWFLMNTFERSFHCDSTRKNREGKSRWLWTKIHSLTSMLKFFFSQQSSQIFSWFSNIFHHLFNKKHPYIPMFPFFEKIVNRGSWEWLKKKTVGI